jgi:hypothetical protein
MSSILCTTLQVSVDMRHHRHRKGAQTLTETLHRDQITEEQREQLLDLLLTHGHTGIGPEVRRELLAGRGRGVPVEPLAKTLDGDDTMLVD